MNFAYLFALHKQGCSKLFQGGVAKVYPGESGGMLPQENFVKLDARR